MGSMHFECACPGQHTDGSELFNYQLLVTELCQQLGVPDPAREDTRDNAYVFERRVSFRHSEVRAIF